VLGDALCTRGSWRHAPDRSRHLTGRVVALGKTTTGLFGRPQAGWTACSTPRAAGTLVADADSTTTRKLKSEIADFTNTGAGLAEPSRRALHQGVRRRPAVGPPRHRRTRGLKKRSPPAEGRNRSRRASLVELALAAPGWQAATMLGCSRTRSWKWRSSRRRRATRASTPCSAFRARGGSCSPGRSALVAGGMVLYKKWRGQPEGATSHTRLEI
jgi:hypothetical protein